VEPLTSEPSFLKAVFVGLLLRREAKIHAREKLGLKLDRIDNTAWSVHYHVHMFKHVVCHVLPSQRTAQTAPRQSVNTEQVSIKRTINKNHLIAVTRRLRLLIPANVLKIENVHIDGRIGTEPGVKQSQALNLHAALFRLMTVWIESGHVVVKKIKHFESVFVEMVPYAVGGSRKSPFAAVFLGGAGRGTQAERHR